ncbi:MAG: potassium channel family protein [bacterium]
MKTKTFAVIGLGRFGSSVAQTLAMMGHEVLAVDMSEERVQDMSQIVTHAVIGDATDENFLKDIGIRNFDVVITAIGQQEQSNVLVTMQAKELGAKYVVAKATSDIYGKILEKIGADRVVYPERDMGERVAHNLVDNNILDYIELSADYSIIEFVAPAKMAGKTLKELDLRARFGVTLVVIKRSGHINASPGADDKIEENDVLVLIGDNASLEKFQRH